MKLSKDVASRIAVLRPLLIFGVVFLHVPGQIDQPSRMGHGWFDYFSGFFSIGLFRATVPTLSLIAGFLLFRAGLDLVPLKLYRKKFKTIAIPFLFFNAGLLLLAWAIQVRFGFVLLRDMLHAAPRDWINALFGVKAVPFNYPLYFLRDLLVLIALAPLSGWFLRRRPWLGFLLVAVVFGCGLDGFLIMRDTSAVVFYVGGWLALLDAQSDTYLLRADRYALPCLVLLALMCAALLVFRIDDNTFLVYAAPFLAWPAVSLLRGTAAWGWALRASKYSFFVFVAHAPLLELAYCVFQWQHPDGLIAYEAFWFIAPVLVIGLLMLVYEGAMRVMPRFFNLITGSRTASRVPVPAADDVRPAYPSAG